MDRKTLYNDLSRCGSQPLIGKQDIMRVTGKSRWTIDRWLKDMKLDYIGLGAGLYDAREVAKALSERIVRRTV